jgi:CarD family transcriptional regulator
MFEIGAKVVYPFHGVGIIKDIEIKKIEDEEKIYYVIKSFSSEMNLFLPVEAAEECGLRHILKEEELEEMLLLLQQNDNDENNPPILNWRQRLLNYTEKLKTGSFLKAAEVARCLWGKLKITNNFSLGERRLWEIACNMLIEEVAAVKSITTQEAEKLVKEYIFSS